jgi:hypothetical protein
VEAKQGHNIGTTKEKSSRKPQEPRRPAPPRAGSMEVDGYENSEVAPYQIADTKGYPLIDCLGEGSYESIGVLET